MDIKGKYLFAPEIEFRQLDLTNYPQIVKAFERRIEGWFFNPLEKLLVNEADMFMASAIESMLVDSFAGFCCGLKRNNQGEDFKLFMRDSLGVPYDLAHSFYVRFRCGILHQTYIKEKSCINLELTTPLYMDNEVLFFNPILFHQTLREFFEDYMNKLSNDTDTQKKFRVHFKYMFEKEFPAKDWILWDQ